MKLYLLRHATATDIAPSDADRILTKDGREEARVAGLALARLKARPDHIFSSPLARAEQTADIIAQQLEFPGDVGTLVELTNGTSTAALLRALAPCQHADAMLLVGHMPSLAEHLAALIGAGPAAGFVFAKTGVACVELAEWRLGRGELRWLLRPKQLRLIAT